MLKNKLLAVAISSVVGMGLSSVALANGGGYGVAPVAPPPSPTGAGFVIGLQGGYADTHWDNVLNVFNNTDIFDTFGFQATSVDIDDQGFAARGFLGYDFNRYFGLEAGYTYLPKAKVNVGFLNGASASNSVKNYTVDLLAKLMIPVVDGFGLYAKAGAAYFKSSWSNPVVDDTGTTVVDDVSHVGPAFGVGATYEIVPNLNADLSWMRYSGDDEIFNNSGNVNTGYQPNPDVFLLGLSYKFPVNNYS